MTNGSESSIYDNDKLHNEYLILYSHALIQALLEC